MRPGAWPGASAQSIALTALATGFVSVQNDEYPPYWPPLHVAQTGCPGLTGTFDNRDLDEAQPTLLAKWLLQPADPLKEVHRVELAGPDAGTLSMRFLGGNGEELLRRSLRDGEHYVCSSGWLELRQAELMLVGTVHRHVARLTRNARGDLVVQDSDVSGGVVLVVPMYASFRHWHVYRERDR